MTACYDCPGGTFNDATGAASCTCDIHNCAAPPLRGAVAVCSGSIPMGGSAFDGSSVDALEATILSLPERETRLRMLDELYAQWAARRAARRA